jgi:4-hydroxythreonine-4-phosphate dehydrogenase
MNQNKINIALLLGDPSGIGPELVTRLLSEEITNKANIIVIGEKNILENGTKISGKKINLKFVEDFNEINFQDGDKFFLDISKGKNHDYKLSECSKESGESVLSALNLALNLAKENKIQAINFGPFNKTSLKLGGNKYSDELHLMAEKLEVKNFFCEFNVIDNFWTARVTSHIPIKEVPNHVKKENILKPIKLINEAMKLNGIKTPRVAVQALNPHAEFGTEEKEEIIPAIEEAKKIGINADGPLPCDTSFITAYKNKNHDCIVGMYHDALQSGLKAFGFDKGVTVQGGLPVPITTPAHGTAFDIAGKNKANLEPTLNSFKIALTMAENKIDNDKNKRN